MAAALRERVDAQKDANRILLEVPESLTGSAAYTGLKKQLQTAGLQPAEATDVALMVMVNVVASPSPAAKLEVEAGSVASIGIGSGSRGGRVRPGTAMQGMLRCDHVRAWAARAIVSRECVE